MWSLWTSRSLHIKSPSVEGRRTTGRNLRRQWIDVLYERTQYLALVLGARTFDDAGTAACVAAGGYCLGADFECPGTIGPQQCEGLSGLCCLPKAVNAGDAGADAAPDDGTPDASAE